MAAPDNNMSMEILAETDNFAVLRTKDIDNELVYNVELGSITIHLFQEEWDEMLNAMMIANEAANL